METASRIGRRPKWVPGESHLTSSNYGTVVGAEDALYSRQKLFRSLHHLDPEEEDKFGMVAYGTVNEHRVVSWASELMDIPFYHTGDDQIRFVKGRFSGAPDGVYGGVGLECKTPWVRPWKHPSECLYKKIPERAMAQMQGNMWLGELTCYVFAAMIDEDYRRAWVVHRNNEYIAIIQKYADNFLWHLDKGASPPAWSKRSNPKPVLPTVEVEQVA